jgi:hypothetical protein
MLSATIYVNKDEILNDDKYEFESIGQPFLNETGKAFYNYELTRQRKYRPDLSAFKIKYDHRDPADQRAAIKVVDN